MSNLNFLGTAIKHPLQYVAGKPVYISGTDMLRQSLNIILKTNVGEQFMVRQFGSRLKELLFQPLSPAIEGNVLLFVKQAIDAWEKRVIFVKGEFKYPKAGVLHIEITYRVRGTDFTDTMVYPFYSKVNQ